MPAPVASRAPGKEAIPVETKEDKQSPEEEKPVAEALKEEGQEEEVVEATATLDLNTTSDPSTLAAESSASATPPTPSLDLPTLTTTSNHPSFPLLRTLFGLDPPTTTPLASPLLWFDETLNESQKIAVRFTLESDSEYRFRFWRYFASLTRSCSCRGRLHPWTCEFDAFSRNEGRTSEADSSPFFLLTPQPGTGKTFTLVEIIRQLVQNKKKKVLVCGASNLSVGSFSLPRPLPRLHPLTDSHHRSLHL